MGSWPIFRGILRRLDDHREGYAYGTIAPRRRAGRAAVFGAAGQPYAGRTQALRSGRRRAVAGSIYARFAFVTPPEDEPRRKGQFPAGERVIPVHLVEPLAAWHSRLGMPGVEVVTSADGQTAQRRGEHAPAICTLGPGVTEAYYRYYDGLLDLVEKSPSADLDGNYARSAEKALRVAMLLASLEGTDQVALRHWARGQQVAERWRSDLHTLVAALAEGDMTRSEQQERVCLTLQRLSSQGVTPTTGTRMASASAA